jgi:hypothetical protein
MLPDVGDWIETCRSCFNVNFNILLDQLNCASVGKQKTLIVSRCMVQLWEKNENYIKTVVIHIAESRNYKNFLISIVSTALARLHVMPWVAGPIHAPLAVLNVGKKAKFRVLKQLYYAFTFAHY